MCRTLWMPRVRNTNKQIHGTKIHPDLTEKMSFLLSCILFFRPLIAQECNSPKVFVQSQEWQEIPQGDSEVTTRWVIELHSAGVSEGHTYSTAALDRMMNCSLLPHSNFHVSALTRQGWLHMFSNSYRLISYILKKMFKSVW